jgi:hydrogenase-4 component E
MTDQNMMIPVLTKLSALTGALFLLTAFALVVIRQVIACLRIYRFQSFLLALSAVILGYQYFSIHLFVVAAITLAVKSILIPWHIRRTVRHEIYALREISLAINIPTSLLIAVAIAILAYFVASPLLAAAGGGFEKINLPVGLAGLFLGAYTVTVRRMAVPQIIGLLAMENGAFFAGVSIAAGLPLVAELAAAFDILIVAIVTGLLTRMIHERIGTTTVGEMTALREE